MNCILKFIALVALAAGAIASAQDFALKNGDTVVFYGDSITDQRLYTTFAETYVLISRITRTVRALGLGRG